MSAKLSYETHKTFVSGPKIKAVAVLYVCEVGPARIISSFKKCLITLISGKMGVSLQTIPKDFLHCGMAHYHVEAGTAIRENH